MEGKNWFIWPVVFLFITSVFCSCYGCWEIERSALLHLKDSINHPNGRALPSWGKHANCCHWEGVECHPATNRVIQLSLNDTRDSRLPRWYLNCSLFLPFQDLKALYLKANNIAGCIENEGFNKLSSLKNLAVLCLRGNYIHDHKALLSLNGILSLTSLDLSSFWGDELQVDCKSFENLSTLKNLEFLDLSGKNLGNRIISYLDGLSFLKTLILNDNQLEGTIHTQGGEGYGLLKLRNLEVLDLSFNHLGNNVFSSLRGLPSLKILYLLDNRLKGSLLTTDLGHLQNLEELDLRRNYIEEFVPPEETTTLSKLKVLSLWSMGQGFDLSQLNRAFPLVKSLGLQNNKFKHAATGEDFQGFKKLEELYLDESFLHENFLQSIRAPNSIKILSLSGCRLNGTLPSKGWCELKNLVELYLNDNMLQGTLASCLGNLESLRVLDLSNNLFTGDTVAAPLANLSLLESLSISNNNFHIPVSFSPFMNNSKLKVLIADSNELISDFTFQTPSLKFQLYFFSFRYMSLKRLPQFLYTQNALMVLDLSHNNLTGTFPSWLINNNSRLEEICLRSNSFVGSFKLPLLPNPNLGLLDIANNNFGGQIPQTFGLAFPNLKFISMDKNAFKGGIPTSLGEIMPLQYLSLSNNVLDGKIASSLGDLTNLIYLDLSNNKLSGEIPTELMVGYMQLTVLKLSNNTLEGEIFPKLFNLMNLNHMFLLRLDGNSFGGEIPDFLPTVSFLPQVLDISNNNISGKLPRWIGNSSNMVWLAMSHNHFEGPIPKEYCGLIGLEYFDLSSNNLSGSIPSCFNLSNIKHIHLGQNRLIGNLTDVFYGSSSLVTLDLSNNHLSGTIPTWINRYSALSVLLLKNNHLEGEIPVQLCQSNKLSLVDLSHNNLSGSMPPCLGNLTFEASKDKSIMGFTTHYSLSYDSVLDRSKIGLSYYTTDIWLDNVGVDDNDEKEQVEFSTKRNLYIYKGNILNCMSGLDLSFNHLSGEIPLEIGNLSQIRALNLSHNNFIGSIPSSISNLRQIESLDLSHNRLSGKIPPQLIELNALAVFNVSFNNLSGPIPDSKGQFGTFDETSYRGNHLLCGDMIHINCMKVKPASKTPTNSEGEDDDGFFDMSDLYVSFVVSYIVTVLTIVAVLFINPHWRQAWFYFIEVCITSCHNFILDGLQLLHIRS